MRSSTTVRLAGVAALVGAGLVISGCAGATTSNGAEGGLSIGVLLASSQNGYNQAIAEGVEAKAKELDPSITVTVLDGQFSASTQLGQLDTAGIGDKYDGLIVVPFDGPALAAGFPLGNGIPSVAVLNPIGPDIEGMEPQVDGVVSTVAVPPADAATKQAEDVVGYCADKDPCTVALLVGQLSAPLDVSREKAYRAVLEAESNIDIVATVEGNYDPAASATAIANVLQSTPDLDVVLSNADQQSKGAQIALEDAGIDPASMYIAGGGGTEEAVQNVRNGIWKADYISFPVSMGEAAMTQLHAQLTGGDVSTWVDADALVEGVDPYATKETLDKSPDFTGEWVG